MNFNNDKAIYLQIADRLCDEILMDRYTENGRVPSVREYSVLLEVNTNTAVRSYEALSTAGIIFNKRGLGYFVSPGAKQRIISERREEFMKQRLPELFRSMQLLDISISDVDAAWSTFKKQTGSSSKEQ